MGKLSAILGKIDKADRYVKASANAFYEANKESKAIEAAYKKEQGIKTGPGKLIKKLDVDQSKRIGDAYAAMQHDPANPDTIKAYNALVNETQQQYQKLLDSGINFEYYRGQGEPYKNSVEMADDIRNNRRMKVLGTEGNYGQGPITEDDAINNPLLQRTQFTDQNGEQILANDAFRAVHDFYGHSTKGTGFGPIGEENAWDSHWAMFSPEARKALTTETRGQNSWVNFGPHMRNADGSIKKPGDEGYLDSRNRPFADQKIGLLPEEFVDNSYRPLVEGPVVRDAAKTTGIGLLVGGGSAALSGSTPEENTDTYLNRLLSGK